jgi:CubicO group peptidase (beta-lactamase class C family)
MPFGEVLHVVREDLKPHFPPQDLDAPRVKARYTDTGYQLLGAIIERVTAQPLHETFEKLIFEPLGLDNTSSYPHPPRSGVSPEPEARVWSKDTVLQVRGALTHQKADGGIVSIVTDQLSFMRALVSGDVFTDPGTWLADAEALQSCLLPGGLRAGRHALRPAPVDVPGLCGTTPNRTHRIHGHLAVPLSRSGNRPRRRIRRGSTTPAVPFPAPSPKGSSQSSVTRTAPVRFACQHGFCENRPPRSRDRPGQPGFL